MRRKIVSLICTCVCFFLLQTANAENILKNRGDSLVVGDLYLLESRYSQRNAALLAGPLETIGFQKYYGGSLPQSITDERRMYTLWSEFSVDSSLKEMELGLGLGPIDYPCEIFFNGVQIGVIGQYEGGYRSILYTSSEVFFPPELVLSGEKKNALALQFFPLYETENKAFGDLVIADFVAVSRTTFLRNLFNTHFIRAAGIIALILFVYFLFLYGVARRRDRKNLLFALTCLAFFFGYFNLAYSLPGTDEVLLEKISRIALFNIDFTGIAGKRRWVWIGLIVPTAVASFIMLFQNSKLSVHQAFSIITLFPIVPTLLTGFVVLGVAVFVKKQKNACRF